MQVEHDGLVLQVEDHSPAQETDEVPVIALHGFPQTPRCWDDVVTGLLAAGRRVLVPYLRGYVAGARPEGDEPYALDRVVGDVLAVADAAGAPRVDLLGHDWGAVAAWAAAGHHPERVRSLVAVSVPHPRAYSAALSRDPDQMRRSAYLLLFRRSGPDHGYKAERVLLDDDARRLRAAFAPLPPERVDLHVAVVGEQEALTGALGWYRGISREALQAVPPVAVPTVFVWGDDDVAVGSTAAHGCADHVVGEYRFLSLEGISHWVPEQAAQVLIEAVLSPGAPTAGPGRGTSGTRTS